MKNNKINSNEGGEFKKQNNLKKKIGKIMKTQENKRNFMPLFSPCIPQIMDDEERKSYLLDVAKKYFKIKGEIDIDKDII